jgi:hypothetical protein
LPRKKKKEEKEEIQKEGKGKETGNPKLFQKIFQEKK